MTVCCCGTLQLLRTVRLSLAPLTTQSTCAGDQEYFAKIPPGGLFTVDTFEVLLGIACKPYTAALPTDLLSAHPCSSSTIL